MRRKWTFSKLLLLLESAAENTTGGIVFESACGRQARSGQDCDGWEENG